LLLIAMSEFIPGLDLESLMPMRVWGWIEMALATPVVLWGAWPSSVPGWNSTHEAVLRRHSCWY